jgi:hypothetical protein
VVVCSWLSGRLLSVRAGTGPDSSAAINNGPRATAEEQQQPLPPVASQQLGAALGVQEGVQVNAAAQRLLAQVQVSLHSGWRPRAFGDQHVLTTGAGGDNGIDYNKN